MSDLESFNLSDESDLENDIPPPSTPPPTTPSRRLSMSARAAAMREAKSAPVARQIKKKSSRSSPARPKKTPPTPHPIEPHSQPPVTKQTRSKRKSTKPVQLEPPPPIPSSQPPSTPKKRRGRQPKNVISIVSKDPPSPTSPSPARPTIARTSQTPTPAGEGKVPAAAKTKTTRGKRGTKRPPEQTVDQIEDQTVEKPKKARKRAKTKPAVTKPTVPPSDTGNAQPPPQPLTAEQPPSPKPRPASPDMIIVENSVQKAPRPSAKIKKKRAAPKKSVIKPVAPQLPQDDDQPLLLVSTDVPVTDVAPSKPLRGKKARQPQQQAAPTPATTPLNPDTETPKGRKRPATKKTVAKKTTSVEAKPSPPKPSPAKPSPPKPSPPKPAPPTKTVPPKPPRKAAPKKPAAQKLSGSKAAVPAKVAPPKPAPPKLSSSNASPIPKPVPEKVVPEKVVPEKVVPEKVVPEKVVPEKVVPEKVVPEKVAPEKVAPEKAAPRKAVSRKIAPRRTAPPQAAETPIINVIEHADATPKRIPSKRAPRKSAKAKSATPNPAEQPTEDVIDLSGVPPIRGVIKQVNRTTTEPPTENPIELSDDNEIDSLPTQDEGLDQPEFSSGKQVTTSADDHDRNIGDPIPSALVTPARQRAHVHTNREPSQLPPLPTDNQPNIPVNDESDEEILTLLDRIQRQALVFLTSQDDMIASYRTKLSRASHSLMEVGHVNHRRFSAVETHAIKSNRLMHTIAGAQLQLQADVEKALRKFALTVKSHPAKKEPPLLRDVGLPASDAPMNGRRKSIAEMHDAFPFFLPESPRPEWDSVSGEEKDRRQVDFDSIPILINTEDMKKYVNFAYGGLRLDYRAALILKLCEHPCGMTVSDIQGITPLGLNMVRKKVIGLLHEGYLKELKQMAHGRVVRHYKTSAVAARNK